MPIFDEVTSMPLSEKLGLLKSEYPELKDIPDDHLISQLGRFYPDTLADPEFRTAYRRVVGQQEIAAETPTEYRKAETADLPEDNAANYLSGFRAGSEALSTLGRSAVRGTADILGNLESTAEMLGAMPRAVLGRNPATGILSMLANPTGRTIRDQTDPITEAPLSTAQTLKEAWESGQTPGYLAERAAEQAPQLGLSLVTSGTGLMAGLSPKAAAIAGTIASTFPQEAGGAFEEIKQQTGKEAPFTASAVGLVNSFLELGGDAKIVERALGGDRLAATTIREAVSKGVGRALGQGAKEAGVEAAQEFTTAELPVATGQTQQMSNNDLAWRLGEAAAGGFLPGALGAGGVDVAAAARGGVVSPAVIPPQVTADQDFAVQVGNLREAARAQRIQQDADDLLAQQMATARQESARQQALIQQAGGSLLAENEVKVKEALAHADALLQNLTIKRQSQAMDIPEVQAGIQLDPTSTTLRIAAEAQRRADMTPQQRAALEMLDRPAQPDVIPVNRLSPTPQQFDAALQNGLPPVQSEPTLQDQRQLGGRIAATPDTTSGLAEPGQSTIAPSPVDMLLAEDRGAFYPVPSRSAFNRGLRNGMPPVRRQAGPVSTDAGLTEAQSNQDWSPVDQFIVDQASNAKNQVTPAGQASLVEGQSAVKAPAGETQVGAAQQAGGDQGQVSPAPAPVSRTAKATEARRQKSALRRQESRGTRIEQAQQPTTKRQRGEMSAIPPRYGAMMERLNTIPQEEKDRASGISSEAPTTDEGWALREILRAALNVELFLSLPENRGNANTAAYIERRYVERVLDTLSDPKRKAPLGPTLLKNRGKFFTQALISVRNDLAEVGQSGGQSEVPTEIETESGTITSPEVENAPRAGEGGWFAKSPAAHNARELINEFIANETGSDAEERAALNLMARALGVPDVHTERDPDRTLAEDSPALKAKVAEFVSDELRAKIVRAHLSGEERVPIGIAAVKAAVAEVTTSPRVQVISDPNLRDENGTPIAGFLREDGTVVLNSAFIDSPQMAREVLLEELMHAVYGDADVQAAWQEVKDSVTAAELQAMADLGYSGDVALEEAAIRKVIGQLNNRNAENVVMRFLRAVVDAIRSAFGVSGQDPYGTILARALESVGPRQVDYSLSEEGSFENEGGRVLRDLSIDMLQEDWESVSSQADFGLRILDTSAFLSSLEGYDVPDQFIELARLLIPRVSIPIYIEKPNPNKGFQGRFIQYHGGDSEIRIQPLKQNGRPLTKTQAVRVVLHEVVHHLITSKAEQISRESINDLYSLITEARARDVDGTFKYQLSNTDEFIAAALTEKRFQNWLKRQESNRSGVIPTLWGRFVELIQRALGISGSGKIQNALDQAISISNEMLSARSRYETGYSVRRSLTDGRWRSPADLSTDVTNAGDPATLKSAAAVQGSLIPDTTVQRIDALVNKPSPTKAERIAARILRPLLDVRQLASSIWGPGSGFSGYAIGGSSGLSTAVPAAQDIAAESVIRQSIDDRARLEKVTERAEAAANVAAVAMSKLPQAAMHQNDAMLYDSMAKQLARDYQDTLAARIQTAKGANDTQLVQVLAQASRNLTQSLRGIGNAVAMALKNIAAEIPDTALTSHAAAEAWIQARVNNPTLPRIMSVAAQDWLFNPPSGRTTAPIQWDQKLHERLKVMKDLAASNSALLAQVRAFNASITGGKAPTVRQVFERYVKFRDAQRDALEKMRLIFREVDRAEAELEGTNLAQRELEAMVRDPDYQARVTEAARHLNASTRGVRVYERAGNQMTGRLIYLNPLTGEQVAIDTTPDRTTENENLQKIQKLTRDVQRWMNSTDDVLLKEAWLKEMQYLMDFGFHQAPGLMTGYNLGGLKVWSIWQLNPMSRHVWRGRLDTRSNLARRIGERLIVPFQLAGIAFDHVQKGLENLVNGRDSEQSVDEATIKALKSHGLKPTQYNVFKDWVPNVLERIISQNQNPTNIPYKVGDWVRGVQITPEDMAAADQQKRHQFAVHSLLQRNNKDSRNVELWRNPVTTEEEVPGGRHLVRRSVDYGLKMARTLRDWAVSFSEDFLKADPAGKRNLIDQNFQDVVMGLVTETNSELGTTIDDADKTLFRKLAKMERDNTLPFSDFGGFLDWMASERAALLGTSPAQERVDTEERFTGYVTGMATSVISATKGDSKVTAEDFLKSGMPKALVQAVAGKDNPFTTARGRMMAPSTWYSYSMTGAGDRAKYRAGALAVLTLREIEAGQLALASIENEIKKYEGERGLIAQEQARNPNQSEMRVRWRVAAQSQKAARMGRLMMDYKSLLDHRATLDYMLKGMARLAAEHVTIPEDVAVSAFLNSTRQTLVGQMLSSPRAIATNLYGAGYALSQFRRMIGSYRFMLSPASYLWEIAKDLTAVVMQSIRSVKGGDATIKLLNSIPGVNLIIRQFIANELRYRQERMRAESAMVVDPSDWRTTARLAGQLKTTGGRLSEGDKNNPLMASVNYISGLPVVRQLSALMKAKFPGGIDRLANTITSTKVRQWLNEIGEPAYQAWRRRDTGAPGWNDLTNYANTHLRHEELGLIDATTEKFWRDLLRPAGGLERLTLDFYERTKGMSPEERSKESFLTTEQEDAVVLEAAKLINLPTPTTTHTISQGKGLSGTFRKWLGLFSRYPINANGVNELINSSVPGDNPKSAWKLMAAAGSIALLVALGSLGSDIGQYVDEIVRGEPRSRPTLAQTLESGNATDLAKYVGLSAAGIYPFWSEMIARALGGTSNRPMMDATRMFVPFGIAADLESTAMRMIQSGDVRYPLEDFIRRYSPAAGALINMADPGDLASRSAARSIRVAAPSDMEIRQSGGAVGNRETSTTPLIRKAANALMVGDESTYQAAVDQAVQLKVEAGATPQAARQSVENQIASRDPAHRIFGRPITPQEEQALLSRMSPVQAQAFQASRNAFARFRSGGRGGRGRSSLRARGGAFGRQRKAFGRRRSAFRVR